METINEEIIAEEQEDKTFRVTWTRIDKLTREEMISNYKGLSSSVEENKKKLNEIDGQAMKQKEILTKFIEMDTKKVDSIRDKIAHILSEQKEEERRNQGNEKKD